MIDTITFRIDLCPGQPEIIERKLNILSKLSGETGEVFSHFCTGSLAGSWDSRIACSIHDSEYRWVVIDDHPKGGRTVQLACDPWLRVEFSLHKWIFGVNCFTYGNAAAIEGCYHFALWLNEMFGVRLPDLGTWRILRLDMGLVVKFPDNDTLVQYLEAIKHVEYPRRKMRSIVYESSVMWVGSASCLKLYGKEAEFKKHDKGRVNGYFKDKGVGDFFVETLDGVLRIELGLRRAALQQRGVNRFCDLENINLNDLWGKNMKNIGLETSQLRIWSASDARVALKMHCVRGCGISADAAFAVWTDLVTSGRKFASQNAGKDKFKRANKIFREIGLSTATNLKQDELPVAPVDLQPWRDEAIIQFLARHAADLHYDDFCSVVA